ncbi:MAG: FAD-dependent oxidoreductase [Anaerovoracaceae bacterium]
MKKILIIGGVAGGATCAARLRRLDEKAEIILFERGEYISYANCGLPYYIGDVIKSRDSLLVQTPEGMRKKYGVDVRTKNEVVKINRNEKTVTVMDLNGGKTYDESYDTLVISTGSTPIRPPIPGIESPRIKTLWTIPDTDSIYEVLREENIKSAVVVGGGFIGLEMAENLRHAGLNVSLVEALDQVMAPLDFEMAQLLHENIIQNGVKLYLGDGVRSFEDKEDSITLTLNSGKSISTELIILSIGIRPNSQLAKDAGLEINDRGGIITDDSQRTIDPNIYAVGDVTEVNDFIFNEPTMIPLASPANKQARITADNIAGANERYTGSQGTSIAKVFDLVGASTGSNEKNLIKRGLIKGKDYESIIITQNDHAGYYPGAVPLNIKLLFSMDGNKIYGAQIVGMDGVDKRIDVIATAIRLNAGIYDLERLELAYAPPYSSAKDPVNMAGYMARNVLNGLVTFSHWDVKKYNPDAILLDLREDAELMTFELPGAKHIPLEQLRDRMNELDPTREIVTFCTIGVRSYNGARALMQNGFSNVKLYPAGTRFFQAIYHVGEDAPEPFIEEVADTGSIPDASIVLDCSGMQCPGPIMKVYETMKEMNQGEVMEVSASDPGFARDISAWSKRTGNTLISNEKRGKDYVALVRKGGGAAPASKSIGSSSENEGKTIIMFSGDLDKVLAGFIIANGAAAMGRPVTMFFTFWGLTALRKSQKQPVKKSFMESMFGSMLPRGTSKLKLSKMNMGGMGTAMMKKIMKDKNVDSLETLIENGIKAGVKIVACTMSMDVMGIKEEELIEGVELGGVGAYLGDAEESNVNLFI